jgi:hypothetical protein
MTDALIFGIVFIAFVILRIVAATIFFYCLLPEGDRCPNCDTPTVRVQSKWWNLCLPWFRTSWCYNCGWEGLLRHGPVSSDNPGATPEEARRHDVKT